MKVGNRTLHVFRAVMLAFCLCLPLATRATTLTVTSISDSGAGTLRNTIASANPGDTIVFNSSLSGQTIQLTSAELLVAKNLTIDASSLAAGIIINGNRTFRVLEITNGANVILNSIIATNGLITNPFSFGFNPVGSGILVNTGAVLTAGNCTVAGCSNFFSSASGAIGALGTVTLNHCTVSGNYGLFGNVGIYCSNAAVTLNNCTVSGNINSQQGGGIDCVGGSLALTNCVVFNNTNRNTGGGGGGGIWISGGTLSLNACTISGNTVTNAAGGQGGGGLYVASGTVGTLLGCTLSGNAALGLSSAGGGIVNAGTLTLIDCTVSGNLSTNSGFSGMAGGIENFGSLTLLNCTVSANTCGQSSGGGIYSSSSLTMTNTAVAGNTVLGPFPPPNVDISGSFSGISNFVGGAPQLAVLGNYGGPTQTMPPLPDSPLIDGGFDSITNSVGTDQRGAARLSGPHVDIGAVELQQSMVVNANDSGAGSLRAAIAGAPDLVLFTNTLSGQTIHLNSGELLLGATNLGIDASTLAAPVLIDGGHAGRIVEVTGGHVVLNSLTLTNGFLTGGAFPSESGGAILVDSGATLTVNNCTLSGNSAVGDFGGAMVDLVTGVVAINNCTFSGNASQYGGGIYNSGGNMTLSNCVFSGNSVTGYSGAFENDGTMVVYNSTLSGNSSVSGGGAIQNGGILTLNNSTLFGNSSAGTGGGIQNNSSLTLDNCTIYGNNANTSQGGGIYNAGTAILTNTIVASNTAATSPDIFGTYLGSLVFVGGNPQLSALGNYGGPTPTMPPLAGSPVIDAGLDTITNSLATDERGYPRRVGGHVDIGAAEFQSPLLVTNRADGPPGTLRALVARVDVGGVITFSNGVGPIQLTNGELAIGKSFTIDGGPNFRVFLTPAPNNRLMEITGGNVTLNSLFLQNGRAVGSGFPTNSGGGALVDPGASLTASNCIFSGNMATNGGGICNLGTLTLNNCTLSSDSAPNNNGGGIYNSNGIITLNGCTLSGDSATHGGGICNSNGTATLYNCTLAQNNTFGGFGGGIENDSSLKLINCTLSANNAGSTNGSGIYNSPSGAVLVMTNTIVGGNSGLLGSDISGSYSGVNNFVGSPPVLSALGSYGGLTQTMPPGAGSPVIDAGTDSVTSFLATDQRGLPRLAGAHVDIGAAELQPGQVLTTVDSIPGSLRYAITYTSAGGVITFVGGLSGQTILLTNGELLLAKNLTIDASGLGGGIGVDGGHAGRVFEITNANVTLNSLTITNGAVTNFSGRALGGGICVDLGAVLTMDGCTVCGNFAGGPSGALGAGLYNGGTTMANNCTLSGNLAMGVGGGVGNSNVLAMNNCTMANNIANSGAGLYGVSSEILNNCTISANSSGVLKDPFSNALLLSTNTIIAGNTNSDVSGVILGAGNLVNNSFPGLVPLGNWGGPTPTMPPMFGSPVIDAGLDSVSSFLSVDQRGYARLSGAHVDIGAVEAQVVPAANAPVLSGTLIGNSFQINFTTVAADFTALTSTNAALPLSNWTVLGNVSGISSGQYQFTDSAATNGEQFYEVVSP